ncbi:MAG TPA: MFS transporter [Alphaproteobacteria bacterium]|nr:MFS transporter [Alphaproteobacteria bacterium]
MSLPPPNALAHFAWAFGSLFFFYAFVQRVAPSVMVEDLMRDFAVGGAIVGNLSAFYFYAYAGLQIPIGVLMDRVGPRRLMSAAALLCGAGGMLFATSVVVEGAYLGRFLVGAGVGFSWVGTLTVIAQWFPARRFALLTGFTQLAGMAGGVFGQAPLAAAVSAFGWRATMNVVALAALVLALALWIVVRDRPHVASRSAGLLAGLASVVRQRETWFNALFGMAMTGPMLAFAGLWGVPYVVAAYGLDRAAAGATTSLMFIGWGIGAPTLGWLSDRIGRRKSVMLGCGAGAVITFLCALYLQGLSLGPLKALLMVHGFFASGMVLSFAAAREHNAPAASGAALGLVNAAVVGSGALLQPLVGLLLDLQWDGALVSGARIYTREAYALAFAVIPTIGLVGTAILLASRETYCRQQV